MRYTRERMVQLGEVRCAASARRNGERGKRAGASIVAAMLAAVVIAAPSSARADDSAPQPAPTPEAVAAERSDCTRQLTIAENAIEHDAKYARNWTDAWYVTGISLVALSVTNVFQVHDYRRSEAIVQGAMSTLLMIQVPTATSSAKALRGIRTAGLEDPCLALANARFVLETNADDAVQHQNAVAYAVPVILNVLAGAIVAVAVQHWDFAGHGAEGLSTLVGIAAGELQTATYPRSSLKVSGTSLQMSF
jgi:hypothetical protein